ncbi:hypothetical protein AGRA3207_002860 [Actinomadura graeca]|uniref:DUF222 domain-containing protein n=1 Tax=Actinomadura graeca TaxID=2750812 RepID=A0ABX8QT58_9ACTN|nr:hypothetical protein [Actinomadura graeca]QXJ21943.1 hypothetical protein AGRA3207_002860 [Actinomadura graeca]
MSESVDLNRASRIRVALSEAAAALADRATGLARTDADGLPGDVTDEARQLAAAVEDVVRLAVLYDRRRGAPWAAIGEALGEVSKQAAQERYAEAGREVDQAIIESWLTGDSRVAGLPTGAEASPETLARLDGWAAVRQQEAMIGGDPDHQVSAGLVPMSTAEHGAMVEAAAGLLEEAATGSPSRSQALQIGYARRVVEWYERLVADETATPGVTGKSVDDLRERLAEARTRLTEAKTGVPRPGRPLT